MKKPLVAFLSSLVILSTGATYAVSSGLSFRDKVSFIENVFNDKFNNEFFNETSNMLDLNGHKVGIYRANMQILVTEVSLFRAIQKLSEDSGIDYYGKKYDDFSKIDYVQKGKDKEGFTYFDHKFVKWATDNLYVSPDTKIYNVKAQDIYNNAFKRFFRLTAESYLFLNRKKGFYKSEQNNYIKLYKESIKDNSTVYFFAPDYYSKYYTDTQIKPYVQDDYSYTPGIAIGFWLRRGMDGTDKLLWKGLEKVVSNYDKDWFKTISNIKNKKK